MYLSYKISSADQKPAIYSGQYGSYVKLSTFTQKGTDFKLDFNINLFGLSELEVLKLVQDFAREHNKTEELTRALEHKKEKGGVRFIWGFLSLASGESYDSGYNRQRVLINQNSKQLQVLFYQRLFSKSQSTITVSGKGTTKSSKKSYVNLEILSIKEEKTDRSLSIISTPQTDNFFDQEDQQTQKVQNVQRNSKKRYCGLPPIYNKQNNFNYERVQSDKIEDRFPTADQAKSLLGHYHQQLKSLKENNSEQHFQRAVLGQPTEKQFLNDSEYKSKLWPIGRTIKYYFLKPRFNGQFIRNYEREIPAVQNSFRVWKNVGINLNFVRTYNQNESDIRIAFTDDGSWSYIGTDCLQQPKDQPTMNFGWYDLGSDGTAIHEIGHALGFHHEHQSPSCRIIWNEQAVKDSLRADGNDWTDQQFNSNIFDKIPFGAVWNSTWDSSSIMHYSFPGKDFLGPPQYVRTGIPRNVKLSKLDIQYIRRAYPIRKSIGSFGVNNQNDSKQINETFNSICGFLGKHVQEVPQDNIGNSSKRYCGLPPIYNKQNNFNYELVQSDKIQDSFPTAAQAKSLLGHYYQKLKSIKENNSEQKFQRSVLGLPTGPQFQNDSRYKSKLWPIGRTIKYCFLQPRFNGQFIRNYEREIPAVQNSFQVWKNVGINLNFVRTYNQNESDIRIAFKNDGSWSYIGTDCLRQPKDQPTMNFGWYGLGNDGTAIHEIGHALGFHHEHQSPSCRIIWDKQAVKDSLRRSGNNWTDQMFNSNIFDKLPVGAVWNSAWDSTSIMHYSFPGQDFLGPPQYVRTGIPRNVKLSGLDIQYIRKAYPLSTRSFRVNNQNDSKQINETFHSICGFLEKNVEEGHHDINDGDHSKSYCGLPAIYGKENNFNLEPVACKQASDAFPTEEQAQSLYNYYLQNLKSQMSESKSQKPHGFPGGQFAVFAFPTEQQFKKNSQYKSKLWNNASTIKYCFLRSQNFTRKYFFGYEKNIQRVRQAFKVWTDTGLNLNFVQIQQPTNLADADIRIAFLRGEGSYSLVGTDSKRFYTNRESLNIGWDVEGPNSGTAIHEIGHALGFYHQHQNPACLLQWNTERVKRYFGGPPNYWDEQSIKSNILDVLPGGSVTNSKWDPLSIMHYGFAKDLISGPEQYAKNGVNSNQVLSKLDKEWIVRAYPKKGGSFQELHEPRQNSQAAYNQILTKLKGFYQIAKAQGIVS